MFNTNDDAKLALTNGQVDAIVVDLPTAFYITSAELDGGKIIGQLPLAGGTPEQFGIVLDKGSALTPCVSQAVDALRDRRHPDRAGDAVARFRRATHPSCGSRRFHLPAGPRFR